MTGEDGVAAIRIAEAAIESFTMEENAAFAVNYMTAWVALAELARVAEGEKVLVTAAAGGVGTAAVQLAAGLGCEVYGLVGSREKLELVRSLGAREALSYEASDCFERLRALSGGVDVVLETVGGRVYRESQDLLIAEHLFMGNELRFVPGQTVEAAHIAPVCH